MRACWESRLLHEHPQPHRRGTFGTVCLSPHGTYHLRSQATVIPCPQDWARAVHAADLLMEARTPTPDQPPAITCSPPEIAHWADTATTTQILRSLRVLFAELIARGAECSWHVTHPQHPETNPAPTPQANTPGTPPTPPPENTP